MLDQDTFVDQLAQLVEINTLSGDQAANAQALDVIETMVDPAVVVERHQHGAA
jgi:hypothetical protein